MKFALVCGASGDIGHAIAKTLAKDGWSLYLQYYQNQIKVENLYNELLTIYPKQEFFTIQADFRQLGAVDQISKSIFSLDGIVFAQGSSVYKIFTEMSDTEIDGLWQEHVRTPMLLVKKLIPKLAANHHGRIVFISSVYGQHGSAMEVAYSTMKGAINSFSNSLAQEVGTLGITVNAIAPGAIKTHLTQQFSSVDRNLIIEETPMGRWGEPADIASWVEMLMQEQSNFITGQVIQVDGGWRT